MIQLFTDGGARGNPGPAAWGFAIFSGDVLMHSDSGPMGIATNNVAEYTALVKGMRRAKEEGLQEYNVVSDSEFMVHQMLGWFKVRASALKVLNAEAMELSEGSKVNFVPIKRGFNTYADSLVNKVLDESRPLNR